MTLEPAESPHQGANDPPPRTLCLSCGALKHDALAQCAACNHTPTTQRDMAEHVLVEAAGLSAEQLAAAAELIRAGGSLEFSPDAIVTAEASFRASRPDAHWLLFYVFFALPITVVALWFLYRWLTDTSPA